MGSWGKHLWLQTFQTLWSLINHLHASLSNLFFIFWVNLSYFEWVSFRTVFFGRKTDGSYFSFLFLFGLLFLSQMGILDSECSIIALNFIHLWVILFDDSLISLSNILKLFFHFLLFEMFLLNLFTQHLWITSWHMNNMTLFLLYKVANNLFLLFYLIQEAMTFLI